MPDALVIGGQRKKRKERGRRAGHSGSRISGRIDEVSMLQFWPVVVLMVLSELAMTRGHGSASILKFEYIKY